MKYILLILLVYSGAVFAQDIPTSQQERINKLMEIWNNLVFDNRDNFFSQMKRIQRNDSDGGSSITDGEYKDLIKMSKLKSIPLFKETDSKGRPPMDERRNVVQETCEKLKGNSYKKCEKVWFEIVDNASDEGDDVTDSEWDKFQDAIKSIKGKK